MKKHGLFNVRRPIYILIVINILFFTLLSLQGQPMDLTILIAGGGLMVLMVTSYIVIVKRQMGDQYIFLIISMLASLGIIMLYRLKPDYGLAQIKFYGLGIVLYFMAYILFKAIGDWDRYIYFYIGGSMALFLITFTLGVNIKGSINWVRIGNFSFQPSEITKIIFVFFIAAYYKLRLDTGESPILVEDPGPGRPDQSGGLSSEGLSKLRGPRQLEGPGQPDNSKQTKSPDQLDNSKQTKSPGQLEGGREAGMARKTSSNFSIRELRNWRDLNFKALIKSKDLIRDKYVFLFIIYLHIFLLLMQRELGMTVLFYIVFISIFYVYEDDYRLLLYNIGLLGLIMVLSYFSLAHVKVRLSTWLNPWKQISGKGYQITQSLFAITAGGFFGTGLGLGSPDYIPEVHTDFIFSAICEEMGLFGGMAVVLLYFLLIYRGFKIALTIKEPFKKIVALGITLIYSYQTFIIIAGVIKLIPLTGITLPFISYGGSSLVSAFIAFGILQAISN